MEKSLIGVGECTGKGNRGVEGSKHWSRYLFESSLTVTRRHQIVDRAERERINALVWQNLGRYIIG